MIRESADANAMVNSFLLAFTQTCNTIILVSKLRQSYSRGSAKALIARLALDYCLPHVKGRFREFDTPGHQYHCPDVVVRTLPIFAALRCPKAPFYAPEPPSIPCDTQSRLKNSLVVKSLSSRFVTPATHLFTSDAVSTYMALTLSIFTANWLSTSSSSTIRPLISR